MLKRKKETDIEPKSVYPVNENFINIIQPSSIDFDDRTTALGENVGKIYAISRYPDRNDYGWLAPLCNLEGTATTIEFHYTESDNLIAAYNAAIAEMKGNLSGIRVESERAITEKKIEDLRKLIQRLAVEKEPVGYINIMLHVQDTDREALNERIKRVSGRVAVQQCNIRLLSKRQGMALKVIAPYGIPDKDVSAMGMRNMPISSFIGGFPMASAGLNDPEGYYIGKTENGRGRIVRLNQWIRGKDRTNSNWFISGIPGVGKSTALKDIFVMEYALGTKIIIFDPNNEFIDITEHPDIVGDVIYCSGEKVPRGRVKAYINPLQARKLSIVTEDDLEDGENPEDFMMFENVDMEEDTSSDLALYIQFLRMFFTGYFGKEEATAGVMTALEECLIETYERFGITWETDIETVPSEAWPLLTDLYSVAEEKCKLEGLSSYMKDCYEHLRVLLYKAGKGADRLWNHKTTLNMDSDFIDLVVSGLQETDEKVKRAQYFNILTWVNHEAIKDRKQRVLVGVDEGYLMVDPEFPDIMKYMRNMSKQFRKFEAGLMFITHAVGDVLDPEVKRFGQAIIDNACYKFIMGCDGKNLKETQDLLDLTEKEVSILRQKNRGQGIFFAGNTRFDLTVDVCDEILAMMGEAGGR